MLEDSPDLSTELDTSNPAASSDEPRLSYLLLSEITTQPGHNPRRHFEPSAMDELVASIRAQGVITPITVRPDGARFILVAGERRFLAAKRAGLMEIPALIRAMTPREAMAAAVAENGVRQDISVAEEAQVARQALDLADGDKDEAGRLLGWTAQKLKARLLLLNATQAVLDAQMEGVIKIGHAELLASLPEDRQAPVLARVVENAVSVEELKRQLATFTQDLATAAFDIKGCAGCPWNSTTQASLFEQNVGDGRCSNRTCWGDKTQAMLSEVKAQAATEHNVVWFDHEKAPGSYTRISADGANGVGKAQITACKSCANNGALICSAPGKEGRIASDVCFDLTCHGQRVQAHQKSLEAPAPAIAPAAAKAAPTPAATTATKAATTAPTDSAAKAPTAAPQALPKRLVVEQIKRFRRLSAEVVESSEDLQAAVDLYTLYLACNRMVPSGLDLPASFAHSTLHLRHFTLLSAEQRAAFRRALHRHLLTEVNPYNAAAESYTSDASVNSAALIALSRTALAGRFQIDAAYLEALTKPMIEALLVEAGFHRSLPGDTEADQQKAFRKLVTLGRADLIKAVLASKHDWSSFVPADFRGGLSKSLAHDTKVQRDIVARIKATSTHQE